MNKDSKEGEGIHVQLGILIPAGIPLDAKAMISREVKSGRRKWSFSKAAGQGRRGSKPSAALTRSPNLALMALFTTATNPVAKTRPPSSLTTYTSLIVI